MSDEIAVGTQVFQRTGRLERLLSNIPACVSTVYVAENGDLRDREHLYDRSYDYDLEVIDMEYDAGLARSRNEIVDRSDEAYLTIVDSDHVVPPNVDTLRTILKRKPSLGGVSGLLMEYRGGFDRMIITGCSIERNEKGIVRDPFKESPQIENVEGYSVVYFDFIANAAMFRRECLEEHGWDDYYTIGSEHLDFYLTYKEQSDWKFGVCPSVVFDHYPGGNGEYHQNRHGEEKIQDSLNYFEEKWGTSEIDKGPCAWLYGPDIYGVQNSPKWKRALVILFCRGPRALSEKLMAEFA